MQLEQEAFGERQQSTQQNYSQNNNHFSQQWHNGQENQNHAQQPKQFMPGNCTSKKPSEQLQSIDNRSSSIYPNMSQQWNVQDEQVIVQNPFLSSPIKLNLSEKSNLKYNSSIKVNSSVQQDHR